jgi:hypothetical protein
MGVDGAGGSKKRRLRVGTEQFDITTPGSHCVWVRARGGGGGTRDRGRGMWEGGRGLTVSWRCGRRASYPTPAGSAGGAPGRAQSHLTRAQRTSLLEYLSLRCGKKERCGRSRPRPLRTARGLPLSPLRVKRWIGDVAECRAPWLDACVTSFFYRPLGYCEFRVY